MTPRAPHGRLSGRRSADAYSYAGWYGGQRRGVAGVLSLEQVRVTGLHFCVWLGVDGFHNGEQVWIQTGLEQSPGDPSPRLYVETQQQGGRYLWIPLAYVEHGEELELAVEQRPDGWYAVTPQGDFGPYELPPGLSAGVIAESMHGTGVANARAVRVAGRGTGSRRTWRPLSRRATDELRGPDWRLHRHNHHDGFRAFRP